MKVAMVLAVLESTKDRGGLSEVHECENSSIWTVRIFGQ